MGKTYDEIGPALRGFVDRQPVFFVATAPLDPTGLVNCSPKGLDSLRVLGPTSMAYLDYVGSGVETIAHVRENGRIVLMLCAFEGPPKIARFHGTAEVLEPGHAGFEELLGVFSPTQGVRAIIRIDVRRISDSCGFGVPLMTYEADRPQLSEWADRKGSEGLATYQRENNRTSLDGLPGLRGPDTRNASS